MGKTEKTAGTPGAARVHQVIMEDRHSLHISGVSDVDSFDGLTVVAYTDQGELTVKGQDLQIQRLNVESGDLSVVGEIDSLSYQAGGRRRGLGRWFR